MSKAALATPDERLSELPLEALECRDLRHAWSRSRDRRTRWVVVQKVRGRVRLAERHMVCTNDCGRIAVDTFEFHDGRRYRVGKRKYRQAEGTTYLLRAIDPAAGTPERVTTEDVGYALMLRLYPDLSW